MATLRDLIVKASTRLDDFTDDDIIDLRRAVVEYPANTVAAALLLKLAQNKLSEADKSTMTKKVALFSGDCANTINMIDPAERDFSHFYPAPPAISAPTTEVAIDTFLETYGHQSPEEDALLEKMIFNPVPEYAETLAAEAANSPTPPPSSGNSQMALIDAFLASNPANEPTPRDESSEKAERHRASTETRQSAVKRTDSRVAPDTSLSESLAKSYIKQGKFERAYEIISHLNLNNSQKSRYFADQLRFLRKLIINQRAGLSDTRP